LHNRDPATAAKRILGNWSSAQCTREERLAYRPDFLGQAVGRFIWDELVVIVERVSQDLKDPPVAIFIFLNAAEVIYQRGQHEWLSGRQFD
jgi:hypothetical protein